MLEIVCPSCNKAYRIALEHQGKAVRCQQCGQTFNAIVAPHLLDSPDDNLLVASAPPPSPSYGQASTRVASPSVASQSNASSTAGQAPRVYVAPAGKRGTSDEIDYAIHGDDTQYVEVALDPGETVIAESGSMMYMSQGIEMQTVFGDPSQTGGGFWGSSCSGCVETALRWYMPEVR